MQAEQAVRAGSLFDVGRKAWVPLVMDVRVSPMLMRAVPGEEPVAYYNLSRKGTTARITTIARWRCVQLCNDEDAIYLWCRDEEELRGWLSAFLLAIEHYAPPSSSSSSSSSLPSASAAARSSASGSSRTGSPKLRGGADASSAAGSSSNGSPASPSASTAAPRVVSELPARFRCMQELKLYATPTRLYLVGRIPDGHALPTPTSSPLYRVLEFDRTIARPSSLGEIMKQHPKVYDTLEISTFVASLYGGGSSSGSSGGQASAPASRRPSIAPGTAMPPSPVAALPPQEAMTPADMEEAIATAAATATPALTAKGSNSSGKPAGAASAAAPATAGAPAASTTSPSTAAAAPPPVLTQDVAALLGAVQFTRSFYLVVVTARRPVGTIGVHGVYGVEASELVPIYYDAPPHTKSTWTRLQERFATSDAGAVVEGRYQSLFLHLDLTKDFYFSYSYDLTRTLQSQVVTRVGQDVLQPVDEVAAAAAGSSDEAGAWCQTPGASSTPGGLSTPATVRRVLPREAFLWNGFLAEELQGTDDSSGGVSTDWIVPLVHGFFDQRAVSVCGMPTLVTLLARRSRHYAGTRYLKRGATTDGHVANDVEVEQIVDDTLGHFSSYVQMRGSIPVPWMQRTNITLPKPPIVLQPKDLGFNAAKRHFADMLERYGAPLLVLNLVKKKERHPREKLIGREFGRAVAAVNQALPPPAAVQYLAVDYSALVKARKYNVLAALRDTARWTASNTGFFCTGVVPHAHLHRRRLAVALRRHRLINQWRGLQGQPAAGLEAGVPRPVPLFRSTTGGDEGSSMVAQADSESAHTTALLDVGALLTANATGGSSAAVTAFGPAKADAGVTTEAAAPAVDSDEVQSNAAAAFSQSLPPANSLVPWTQLLKDTKPFQKYQRQAQLHGDGSTPATASTLTAPAPAAVATVLPTGRPASSYLGTTAWVLPSPVSAPTQPPEFATPPAVKLVTFGGPKERSRSKPAAASTAASYFSALCEAVATPAVAVADAVTAAEARSSNPAAASTNTAVSPGLQVGVPVHLMGCQPPVDPARAPTPTTAGAAGKDKLPAALLDADLSDVDDEDEASSKAGWRSPAAARGFALRFLEAAGGGATGASGFALSTTAASYNAGAASGSGSAPTTLSHSAPALLTASGMDPDASPPPLVYPGFADPVEAAAAAASRRSVWCNNDLQELVLQQALAGQVPSSLVVNTTSGLAVRLREYESVAGHGDYCYVNLRGTAHGYHSEPLIPAIATVGDLRVAVRSWTTSDAGASYPAHESGSTPGSVPLPPFLAYPALGLRLQSGVLRTNCVDCMDRTNVGQVCVGVHVLGLQMHALGLSDNETLDPSGCLVELMMDMYEALGDHIALQYGGSEANKRVTTAEHAAAVRVNEGYEDDGTGRRKGGPASASSSNGRPVSGYGSDSDDGEGEGGVSEAAGGRAGKPGGGGGGGGSGAGGSGTSSSGAGGSAGGTSMATAFNLFGTSASSAVSLSFGGTSARPSRLGGNPATELLSSLQRYYANSFTDSIKQAAINLFLGVFQPRLHADPLWELETDYFLHNSDLTQLAGVADAEERAGAHAKAAPGPSDCSGDWWSERLRKYCVTGLPRVEAVLPPVEQHASRGSGAARELALTVTPVEELTTPQQAPLAQGSWGTHVARGVGGPILSQAADASSLTLFDEMLTLAHVAPFGSGSNGSNNGGSGGGSASSAAGNSVVTSLPSVPEIQASSSVSGTLRAAPGSSALPQGLATSGRGTVPAGSGSSPQRPQGSGASSAAAVSVASPSRGPGSGAALALSAAPLRLQTVRREAPAASATSSGPAVPAIPPRGLLPASPPPAAAPPPPQAAASTAANDNSEDASSSASTTTRNVDTDRVLARGGLAAGRPLSAAFSIYGPMLAGSALQQGEEEESGSEEEGKQREDERNEGEAEKSASARSGGGSSRRSSAPGLSETSGVGSPAPASRSRLGGGRKPGGGGWVWGYSSESDGDGEAYELSLFADALPARRKPVTHALPPAAAAASGSSTSASAGKDDGAKKLTAAAGVKAPATTAAAAASTPAAPKPVSAPAPSPPPSLVFGSVLRGWDPDATLPAPLPVDKKQYPGVGDPFVLRRQDACGDLLFDTEVAAGGGEGVTSSADLECYGRYVDLAWTVGAGASDAAGTAGETSSEHTSGGEPPRKASANPFGSAASGSSSGSGGGGVVRALTADATKQSSAAAALAAREAALATAGLPRLRAQVVSSLAEVDVFKRCVGRGTQAHTDTQDIESNRRWQAENGLTIDILSGPFAGLPRNRLLSKLLAPAVAAEASRREAEATAALGAGSAAGNSLLDAPAQPVPVLIFGSCL